MSEAQEQFAVGDLVMAAYKGRTKRFAARITAVNRNGTYDVTYDDGDKEMNVAPQHISRRPPPRPTTPPVETKLAEGERIKARFKGRGFRYYDGVITKVNLDNTYDILYDDGETELGAPRDNIIAVGDNEPAASLEAISRMRAMMKGSIYVPPAPPPKPDTNTDTDNESTTSNHTALQVLPAQPSHLSTRMTFRQVSNILNTSYNYEQSIQSTTLDIIAVYLKGQKVLYTEAKTYCEMNLYMLMLPTIAISALCTLLSTELKNTAYGSTIVASLTAFNSFLLSLVTYLKLDAKAEAHKTSAYSFEKLQARCEFNSGKVLFLTAGTQATTQDPQAAAGTGHSPMASFSTQPPPPPPEEPQPTQQQEQTIFTPKVILHEIESKIMEIKDTNSFLLPEAIRYKFPTLTSTNIFSEVKRLQNREIMLINSLKTIINRQQEVAERLARPRLSREEQSLLVKQQEELSKEQNNIFDKVIAYRDEYLVIDRQFTDEIKKNMRHWSNAWCMCCRWLKT